MHVIYDLDALACVGVQDDAHLHAESSEVVRHRVLPIATALVEHRHRDTLIRVRCHGREEGERVCQQPLGSLGLCALMLAVAVAGEGTFRAVEGRALLDQNARASREAFGHCLLRATSNHALPERADEAQCRVFHFARRGRRFLGHPHETRMAAREDDELRP